MFKNSNFSKSIIESAIDGIFVIDENGTILFCNSFTQKMFGFSHAELIGQNIKMIMPSPYREAHDQYLEHYRKTGEKHIIGVGRRVTAQKKDGTIFPVSLAVNEILEESTRYFVGIVRDITKIASVENELIKTTEELKRSNAELEQFAYVASHDLQEPLRMVANFTELLAKRYKGKFDTEADEFIEFILDGATRMQTLIRDLLSYSRVGSQAKELEPTSSEKVFREVLTHLGLAIEQSGAQITSDPLPMVMADRSQLGQVFQNLIANAIKFHSDQTPQIHVSAKEKEGQWVFSVQDNGIGIEPEYFERIFIMFQRLHGKNEYKGTGIGLAVCKRIIDRHGGKIWLESTKSKGSTFYFSLSDAPSKD